MVSTQSEAVAALPQTAACESGWLAGCDQAYHTYCVGLDAIPEGTWYCPECSRDWQPPAGMEHVATVPRTHRPTRRSRRQVSQGSAPPHAAPDGNQVSCA